MTRDFLQPQYCILVSGDYCPSYCVKSLISAPALYLEGFAVIKL